MQRTKYGIPLSETNEVLDFKNPPILAPGVMGYAIEARDGFLDIPVIFAEDPGSGQVAKFLDDIPKDAFIRIQTVINLQLEKMLLKRGFRKVVITEYDGSENTFLERRP